MPTKNEHGADGGGRTHTSSRILDFESSASANSATSALFMPGLSREHSFAKTVATDPQGGKGCQKGRAAASRFAQLIGRARLISLLPSPGVDWRSSRAAFTHNASNMNTTIFGIPNGKGR